MTGNYLVTNTRALVHETGAGYSDGSSFFTDAEVIQTLTAARADLVRLLAAQKPLPMVVLSKMLKTTTATEGTNVPSDFFRLVCGFMADNRYVPAKPIAIAEAMKSTSVEQVYVKAGFFFGTADNALYIAFPSQTIANNSTVLTEFTDGFYNTVMYLATMSLLAKERAASHDRFSAVGSEFQRKTTTFT